MISPGRRNGVDGSEAPGEGYAWGGITLLMPIVNFKFISLVAQLLSIFEAYLYSSNGESAVSRIAVLVSILNIELPASNVSS